MIHTVLPRGRNPSADLLAAPSLTMGDIPGIVAAFYIRRMTVKRIQETVAAHYRIPETEMTSERRARWVARPRQVAMFLARELTPQSLPAIGRMFGGRDHTTVIHAIRKVERLMRADEGIYEDVARLRRKLAA